MHAHDPHAAGHADHHAAPSGARDPEWSWWLGATLAFLGLLLVVFALPATHAAGPPAPVRPLAPHADEHGAGAHEAAHDDGASHAPAAARTEGDRMADLFAAMAGGSLADDSVPPEVTAEIQHLIRAVAESRHTFVHDEKVRTAEEEALALTDRWQKAETPYYSPEMLIRQFAGFKLIDLKTNRVRLEEGGDRPLADWMHEQVRAFRETR